MTDELAMLEISSRREPTASVIWLHGLGADGHDFVNVPKALTATEQVGIKYILPHAPLRPVTMNQGFNMRAWFDLKDLENLQKDDLQGIDTSRSQIESIVQQQEAELGPGRTVLVGFSQGGSMAMYTAMYTPVRLAGVIALASCMLNFQQLRDESRADYQPFAAANINTPFKMINGSDDQVIPLHMGQDAASSLRQAGYGVEFVAEPAMGHNLTANALNRIDRWLCELLG